MSTSSYQQLAQRHQRMYRLGHLQSIAAWDQSAFMPTKGNDARAAALAEVGGLLHEMGTAPELKTWLDQAAAEPLSDFERDSLREMRRAWMTAFGNARLAGRSTIELADLPCASGKRSTIGFVQ